MNNQREAFEKWHKTKYRGLKYNHDSNGGFLNPRTDLDFDIWKSAQTDQSETITKLQLDNAKLREALNYYSDAISIDDSQCECGRGTNTLDDGYKAREALATTSQAIGETE